MSTSSAIQATTPNHHARDTYHGVEVMDEFCWLEDGNAPAVKAWTHAQTQHPELASAVVAHVGIYDMLRFELEPNGAFNVTEFGTVEDPAQFRAMLAYSPYHQVRDGTSYPAVLLLTGENDGRVSPANSRKIAASLQQANASANPILVQLSRRSRQGTALAERIAENADILAIPFTQLGMTQPKARNSDSPVWDASAIAP